MGFWFTVKYTRFDVLVILITAVIVEIILDHI